MGGIKLNRRKLISKSIITFVIFSIILSINPSNIKAATPPKIFLYGIETPVQHNIITINGVIYLPIAEADLFPTVLLNVAWNKEYKGFRIDTQNKSILLIPNSKMAVIYDIKYDNFNNNFASGNTGFVNEKVIKLPNVVISKDGILYLSVQSLGIILNGKTSYNASKNEINIECENCQFDITTNLQQIHKKCLEEYGLLIDPMCEKYEDFVSYAYNSGINLGFIQIQDTDLVESMMGKTIWVLTISDPLAFDNISNLTEIKIVDIQDNFKFVSTSGNKKLILSIDILKNKDSYLTENPFTKYKSWSKKYWDAIKKNEVILTMNKDMVILAIGKPTRINTIKNSSGTYEQWVYDYGSISNTYIYFKNGKVSSMQY